MTWMNMTGLTASGGIAKNISAWNLYVAKQPLGNGGLGPGSQPCTSRNLLYVGMNIAKVNIWHAIDQLAVTSHTVSS